MPRAAPPFTYCPSCAHPGLGMEEGKKLVCPDCGFTLYLNVAAATACFVRRGGLVLFGVRAHEPRRGFLDLPGGFVDPDEGAVSGLVREVQEELGLSITEERLRFLFSYPNRYPYRGVDYATCDLFFELELGASDPEPVAADDVASLSWRVAAGVGEEELAFESQRQALRRFVALAGAFDRRSGKD